MPHQLARLARYVAVHWKRSLLVSLALVVGLIVVGSVAGGAATDDFEVPGTESQEAIDLFREHTPALAGADASIVFSTEDGKVTDPDKRARVQKAVAALKKVDHVVSVGDPTKTVAPDGSLATTDVRFDIEPTEVEKEDGEAVEKAARQAEGGGVDVAMRGVIIDTATEQEAPIGELIGIAFAILLLSLLFRSGAAMGVALGGALIGVMFGQVLLMALSRPLGLPEFASIIAVMLGLGAGIDYALLILQRFREQLAIGDTVRDAAARAASTAGSAVVSAGLIVVVAIAGLLVVGIPLIGGLGIGSAIGVAAVVISALTFLPTLMGAFAKRLVPARRAHVEPSPGFQRWGTFVTKRPLVSIAFGVLLLLVFAAPALNLRLGQPDDGNQPTTRTQRVAYDRLSDAFGPGSNGPFLLAVDTPKDSAETKGQLKQISSAVRDTPGVAAVLPPAPSKDGEIATITAIPTTSPQDKKTSDLLDRLRSDVLPGAVEGTPLKVYVGGQVPGFEDFSDKVAGRLPLFILVVIGLSVLLLMAAFRSFWIPLVSAVFNLLSIVAAYGVVTAVFQDGVGASLIGVDSGVPVVSFVPVMMFAILFGLSMDYNVFLLSRIHEAFNGGDPPRESVIHGVARIGKVVLFAGLIMGAVFLGFVATDDVISKMFGIGLGLAILLDVLLIRLVIAPAVVTLLGRHAWELPPAADRLLPAVPLEGKLVDRIDEPVPVRFRKEDPDPEREGVGV